jgi:hypothetical protein
MLGERGLENTWPVLLLLVLLLPLAAVPEPLTLRQQMHASLNSLKDATSELERKAPGDRSVDSSKGSKGQQRKWMKSRLSSSKRQLRSHKLESACLFVRLTFPCLTTLVLVCAISCMLVSCVS